MTDQDEGSKYYTIKSEIFGFFLKPVADGEEPLCNVAKRKRVT